MPMAFSRIHLCQYPVEKITIRVDDDGTGFYIEQRDDGRHEFVVSFETQAEMDIFLEKLAEPWKLRQVELEAQQQAQGHGPGSDELECGLTDDISEGGMSRDNILAAEEE